MLISEPIDKGLQSAAAASMIQDAVHSSNCHILVEVGSMDSPSLHLL